MFEKFPILAETIWFVSGIILPSPILVTKIFHTIPPRIRICTYSNGLLKGFP